MVTHGQGGVSEHRACDSSLPSGHSRTPLQRWWPRMHIALEGAEGRRAQAKYVEMRYGFTSTPGLGSPSVRPSVLSGQGKAGLLSATLAKLVADSEASRASFRASALVLSGSAQVDGVSRPPVSPELGLRHQKKDESRCSRR